MKRKAREKEEKNWWRQKQMIVLRMSWLWGVGAAAVNEKNKAKRMDVGEKLKLVVMAERWSESWRLWSVSWVAVRGKRGKWKWKIRNKGKKQEMQMKFHYRHMLYYMLARSVRQQLSGGRREQNFSFDEFLPSFFMEAPRSACIDEREAGKCVL